MLQAFITAFVISRVKHFPLFDVCVAVSERIFVLLIMWIQMNKKQRRINVTLRMTRKIIFSRKTHFFKNEYNLNAMIFQNLIILTKQIVDEIALGADLRLLSRLVGRCVRHFIQIQPIKLKMTSGEGDKYTDMSNVRKRKETTPFLGALLSTVVCVYM